MKSNSGKRTGLIALLLWLLFAGVFVARLPEPLGPDQGLFAGFARWVPQGDLPYRDLYDTKPPLFLYWFALAALIPAEFPRALFWLEGAWLVLTLSVAFVLVSGHMGRAAGTGAAGLLGWGLWSPGFGGFWARVQAEEVLALPMLGSAYLALRAEGWGRRAFCAGVLAGVCGLMKVPALAVLGAWATFWLWHLPQRGAFTAIVALVAGALVPWVCAVCWFGAHGETSRFLDAVFRDQVAYASLISPRPWLVATTFVTTLLVAAALPCTAAALGICVLARRRAPEAIWLGAWLAFCAAAILLQRQLAGYHFLLAVPPLAVAGGYGVAAALRGARLGLKRRLSWVMLAVCSALAARDLWNAWRAYGPGIALLRGRMSRPHYLREVQQSYPSVYEEEVARLVRERTGADDRILVWAWQPGIYALSDRRPLTRYTFHRVLLTEAPFSKAIPGVEGRRAELLRAFVAQPPRYVIVGSGDRSFFDTQDSRDSLAALPGLAEGLVRDYDLEHRVGRLTLYRRRR